MRTTITKSGKLDTLADSTAAWDRALTDAALNLAKTNQEDANRRLNETHAQLIQNEKMASLGQLVAGIAHDINNPLAFVLNNLFLVETGLDALGPEIEPHLSEHSLSKLRKTRNRLGEMQDGLDRIKELVLDLQTFSRLDEGELKIIDVPGAIDAVLLLLSHKMNGRIQVEKHYAPARTLYCYAGRLHQVLMNLIANAVDAIAGEGKIVITTSQTPELFPDLDSRHRSGYPRSNPKQDLRPVLHHQADRSGHRPGVGDLLWNRGGPRRLDRGSKRRRRGHRVYRQNSPKPAVVKGTMKEKLLILDDEELILTSLEHLFEDDYEVFATTDAETALGMALVHDLAVILCDERMPGSAGTSFCGV